MLAGRSTAVGGMVAAALENLKSCFIAVGVTERFEDSILRFAKLLRWRPPLYIQRNVTQLADEVAAERAAARARIAQDFAVYYRADYTVYNAADKALSDWIETEGAPYQRAREAFSEIQADIAKNTSEEMFERYEFGRDDQLPPFAARYADSTLYRVVSDYLEAPPRSTPKSNFMGTIDHFSGADIRGWATDLTVQEPIYVTLRRNGQPVAKTICNRRRDDLIQAGLSTAIAGFRFDLERPMESPSEYTVCFKDTLLELDSPRHAGGP
jgi:hypothetical protein